MVRSAQTKMELRDPQDLACSEIRAASLVDCAGSWSFFKKVHAYMPLFVHSQTRTRSHMVEGLDLVLLQACVRDAAISSVAVNFPYKVLCPASEHRARGSWDGRGAWLCYHTGEQASVLPSPLIVSRSVRERRHTLG